MIRYRVLKKIFISDALICSLNNMGLSIFYNQLAKGKFMKSTSYGEARSVSGL